MIKEIDHEYTNEIVCPWCGYQLQDSWEYEDDGIVDCMDCGKKFHFERCVTVDYTTEKGIYGKCEHCNKENVFLQSDNMWGVKINNACESCLPKLRRQEEDKYMDNLRR